MEERKTAKGIKSDMPHNIVMENRKRLSVSGVSDVESFNEEEILLLTDLGGLCIKGNNLRIGKLSIEIGEVSLEGDIDSIAYSDVRKNKGAGFLTRIFR